ncbi:MAG: FCD domain-containing protein [Streptomyces sp.]|jgi:DNA-binding FadR family transcriptional regulator|nr:FCD domain-containing protein [Streptomyces sp.]
MPSQAEFQGARRLGGTKRSGVADEAISRISEMIERGTLGPGERLPRESDLAAQLGLSRSSLREAIRALTVVGALEARQGAGTYVTSLSPQLLLRSIRLATQLLPVEMAADLFEVRRILEPRITALAAARMAPAELEALDADLARIAAAAERGDVEELTIADSEFHSTIARSVGNTFLSALQDSLAVSTLRTLIWQMSVESGPDAMRGRVLAHERIRNAIAGRDPGLAQAASEAHLAVGEAWLRTATRFRGDASQWSAWL